MEMETEGESTMRWKVEMETEGPADTLRCMNLMVTVFKNKPHLKQGAG